MHNKIVDNEEKLEHIFEEKNVYQTKFYKIKYKANLYRCRTFILVLFQIHTASKKFINL